MSTLIYGATRRWQCDYFNIPYYSRKSTNGTKQKIISFVKSCPFFPPISIYHTFLILKHKDIYSFSPAIPLRKNHIVSLENYDSLYDYNSLKRLIYEPFFLVLFFFSKGKFDFYSESSKKSMRSNIFTKQIMLKSNTVDFFQIKDVTMKKRITTKKNIISFVGDFYLKGGLELLDAVQKIELIKNYEMVFIIPKKQVDILEKFLINYNNKCKLTIKVIDELNPSEYLNTLLETKIYVHPTFYDSHAIVAKEAKQLGCKTIVTDVFDSATEADIVIPPENNYFINYRLKFPYSGQWIISKYSSRRRKLNIYLSKQIERALREIIQ